MVTPPMANQGQAGSPCDGVGALCEDPDGDGLTCLEEFDALKQVLISSSNQ